jgi:hypothetical protein
MPAWTAEQILALAPDAAVAKDGKSLAAPRKWTNTGRDAQAVWGEIKGSAKTPYQAQIDLTGPAFKCSCPSHKRPCKHTLALFLLFEAQPESFGRTPPPDWVASYLEGRAKRAQKAKEKKVVTDADAQAGRAAGRQAKVEAGLAELELWLRDLVRQGLARLPEQPQKFWKTQSARMIDAQAPGVARLINELSGVPASGEGWQERMLERMSRLYLLVESFKRFDSLSPETQADVRAAIGWTLSKSDAAGEPGVNDRWAVMGRQVTVEEGLRTQQLWLWGQATNRAAVVLDFAPSGQPFETNLLPGTRLDSEVVFFPGAYPLRAFVRESVVPASLDGLSGYPSVDPAVRAYALALASNPWIEAFPLSIQNVIPAQSITGWMVRDPAGHALSISRHFDHPWTLMAMSGGHPLSVFGLWDGEALLPLSAWTEGRFVGF